jgi:hypothetical protein
MSTWPNRGASGGPCGGLEERRTEQPKPSDHTGLTQANRPPRNPVWFRTVALVVDWGVIGRPVGAADRWLARVAPEVVTSDGPKPTLHRNRPMRRLPACAYFRALTFWWRPLVV